MVRFSLLVIIRALNLAASSGLSLTFQGELHSVSDDGSLKWRWAPPEWYLEEYKEDVDGNFYVRARGTRGSGFPVTHQYDGFLCALDGVDGSVKWEILYPYKDFSYAATQGGLAGIINDAVYIHRGWGGHDIDAIDKTGVVTGTWQQVGDTTSVGPEGSVVAYDNYPGTTLTVLSQDIGKVKWSFTHQALFKWAISEDGGIFALLVNFTIDQVDLIYLDGHDGSVAWNVSSLLGCPRPNSLDLELGSNGEVYLRGPKYDAENHTICNLFAFDASGNMLRNNTACSLGRRLLVTQPNEDGTLEDVFVHTDVLLSIDYPFAILGSSIIAYSGTTGNLLWNVTLAGEDFSGDLSLGQDGTIFARSGMHCRTLSGCDQVVAIRNGVEAWRVNATDFLLAQNNMSYFRKGTLVMAVDKDGSQMWSYDPQLVAPTFPPMALV